MLAEMFDTLSDRDRTDRNLIRMLNEALPADKQRNEDVAVDDGTETDAVTVHGQDDRMNAISQRYYPRATGGEWRTFSR